MFSFDLENYELGIQSPNDLDYQLANSAKGQHIHFIINNGPYSAKYTTEFVHDKWDQTDGNNVVLAFLSRSYHESVKNKNAYFLTQIGGDDSDKKDLSKEEIAQRGGNSSMIHIDWMIGSDQIDVDGIDENGNQEPIFRKGEWVS